MVVVKLPREGYTSITIDEELSRKVKEFVGQYNAKIGYRRYRSVSHFIEEAIAQLLRDLEGEKVGN